MCVHKEVQLGNGTVLKVVPKHYDKQKVVCCRL